MSVIAIIQQKGGVGKTTITANVAGELVVVGCQVEVFDLDPQRSLDKWASTGPIGGVLHGRTHAIDTETLDFDAFLRTVMNAHATSDYVLLDNPPGFPKSVLWSALIADLALLPITPSPIDIAAVAEALNLVEAARENRGGLRPRVGIVPSRINRQTLLGRDLALTLAAFGEPVLPAITQRIALAESVLTGQTLREYRAASGGVLEFSQLTDAIRRLTNGYTCEAERSRQRDAEEEKSVSK